MAFVASVSACLKTQLVLGVGKALLPKTGFSVWLVAKKPICTSQPFSAAGVRVGQAVAFRVLLQPPDAGAGSRSLGVTVLPLPPPGPL